MFIKRDEKRTQVGSRDLCPLEAVKVLMSCGPKRLRKDHSGTKVLHALGVLIKARKAAWHKSCK